ncbi:hypothetical protein P7M20_00035 [Vibrio parahaemolyticus]|nr:hypothetical protein [Vibrio parahaemolyticus]MDW1906247.1 hypothetical protein [Vibrio sp. 705]
MESITIVIFSEQSAQRLSIMFQIPRINTPLPLVLLFTSFNCLAIDAYFVPYAPNKQDCVDLNNEWEKERKEAHRALMECVHNSKQKPFGQLEWNASEMGISNYVGCDSDAASLKRIRDNQPDLNECYRRAKETERQRHDWNEQYQSLKTEFKKRNNNRDFEGAIIKLDQMKAMMKAKSVYEVIDQRAGLTPNAARQKLNEESIKVILNTFNSTMQALDSSMRNFNPSFKARYRPIKVDETTKALTPCFQSQSRTDIAECLIGISEYIVDDKSEYNSNTMTDDEIQSAIDDL